MNIYEVTLGGVNTLMGQGIRYKVGQGIRYKVGQGIKVEVRNCRTNFELMKVVVKSFVLKTLCANGLLS